MFDPDLDDVLDIGDFVEVVDLLKVRPDGKTATYSGITALGRARLEEVVEPGGALVILRKVTWHLRASTLPADVVPDRDDRIVSTSRWMAGTYLILTASLETAGTRWNCPSQQWRAAG